MKEVVHEKIRESHLSRVAYIYIRQSSERQVQNHQESSRVQYALTERAQSLGWKNPITIDEDLGKSAEYFSTRSGFQTLVSQVSMGEVGIVISLDATRLARNNSDMYRLIDLCTIFDTLIGDHQGIYDPKDPNDRLLLGMKGTLSEAELNMIKFRMRQGRLSKAGRGQLYGVIAPGYIVNEEGEMLKSSDSQERHVMEILFKKFKELGSANQTHFWFIEEKILVPVNGRRNGGGEKRRWQVPTYSFIINVLHNPVYAGAYVYGRRASRVSYKDGRIKKTFGHYKSPEEWDVLIHDHHEGYISWEEYEENVRTMRNNRSSTHKQDESVGAIRRGKALLVGVIRCQRCGRKMHVRYWGTNGIYPQYQCPGDYYYGGSYCQGFSALKTDRVFEEELFKALEPAALQASIEAGEVIKERYREKIGCLEKELERARYCADRAFTQYDQVDPLNRLVAPELERRWNEKLTIVNDLQERIAREKKEMKEPSEEEIKRIKSLAKHFPEIWRHPETDPAIKKRIIRLVIEEVLILLDDQNQMLTMTIHWKGGVHTQVRFKKPGKGDAPLNKTAENIVELVGKLAPYYPDEEIARIFNCLGLRTGYGNVWDRSRVRTLRSSNKIAPFDRTKKRNVVSLNEASKRLGVNPYTIRTLIKKGIIKAHQMIEYAPFEIEPCELEKEVLKTIIKRLQDGESLRHISRINEKQMNLF